jgi:hypothetical protein
MTDRINPNNASEAVGAEARYKLLHEKYEALLAECNQWKIKFEVTVIGSEIDVVGSLGNGKGVRKTLKLDAVEYWKDDKNSLAINIADEMLEALLGNRAREELAAKLIPALTNLLKITGK